MTLEEFKYTLREQFFALLLDQKEALAAIPKMLPKDRKVREEYLEAVRSIVYVARQAGRFAGQAHGNNRRAVQNSRLEGSVAKIGRSPILPGWERSLMPTRRPKQ